MEDYSYARNTLSSKVPVNKNWKIWLMKKRTINKTDILPFRKQKEQKKKMKLYKCLNM